VPERDRTAVDVHLGEVGATLLLPREDDGREGLVDLDEIERTGGRYGLQTMCEGGGQANVTIIERL